MTQSPPTGDLVAKLRDGIIVRQVGSSPLIGTPDFTATVALMTEAADAITTLERELEEMRADRDAARKVYLTLQQSMAVITGRLTASQEALRQVVADYDACSGAEPSLSVLHRSIDLVARAALEPSP